MAAALTGQPATAGGRHDKNNVDWAMVHRRLDRTPEPADKFKQLSPENKGRIHDLRSAVENTKLKMSQLEEDLEQKQLAIEQEQALRRAVEEQLQENLVDMYGNPAVNEELRHRLPRSSPSQSRRTASLSPRFKGHRITENHSTRRAVDSDVEEKSKFRDIVDAKRSLDFAVSGRRRSRRERRRAARQSVSSSGEESDIGSSRGRTLVNPTTPDNSTETRSPEHLPSSSISHSHSSSTSTVSPYYTMVMAPVTCIPQTTTCDQSIITPGVQPPVTVSPTSMGGLPNPHLPGLPCPTPLSGSNSAQQISYLLDQLQLARENNKNLTEKLTRCEEELKSAKRSLHTKEVETDALLTGQVAAVIEEIHQSQVKRESAILGRLKLANEERDTMYSRLKHYGAIPDDRLEKQVSHDEDEVSSDEYLELDIEALLSKVNTFSSPSQIERTADHVTALIAATHRRREEVISEEMQIVLEERDIALAKCQKLEKQVLRLERRDNPYSLNQSPEKVLQTKLSEAHHELDVSQSKVLDLEEELQTLRIYHSLRKDVLTTTEINNTVDLYEVQLQEKDTHVSSVQKENNILLAQVRGTVVELEKARNSLQECQKRNEKLERLVKVLKRKINTADAQETF